MEKQIVQQKLAAISHMLDITVAEQSDLDEISLRLDDIIIYIDYITELSKTA